MEEQSLKLGHQYCQQLLEKVRLEEDLDQEGSLVSAKLTTMPIDGSTFPCLRVDIVEGKVEFKSAKEIEIARKTCFTNGLLILFQLIEHNNTIENAVFFSGSNKVSALNCTREMSKKVKEIADVMVSKLVPFNVDVVVHSMPPNEQRSSPSYFNLVNLLSQSTSGMFGNKEGIPKKELAFFRLHIGVHQRFPEQELSCSA